MQSLLKPIDVVLDRITMYRLVLYVLSAILVVAIGESLVGILHYSPLSILISASLATGVCWAINMIGARLTSAATSVESVYITAFIVALIMPPVTTDSLQSALVVIAASAIAMASKYVLVLYKKHLFNPAALGAYLTGLLMTGYASWWVGGNIQLLPAILIGGLALVHKIRRFDLVLSFAAAALLSIVVTTPSVGVTDALSLGLLHTPLLFFAFIMLTEPLTTPPTRNMRIVYGALVGLLFAPAIHLGTLYSSPEFALLIGNIFSYGVSPKGRYMLTLLRGEETSASTGDFFFRSDSPIPFCPGQFMEWTIPHARPDNRGTRRFFTIASSPTEAEIRLGVRFSERKSSFKQALDSLVPGDTISATQLAGEFTLPHDPKEKLAFIAGGIGVTPFRSHLKYLLDRGEKRDIVMLYANRTPGDIAYMTLFTEAEEKLGTKVVHVVSEGATRGMRTGMITKEVIESEIPDYTKRTFYISGPQAMVQAMKGLLLQLGLRRAQIHTDYFIGLT